jgi:hypothetical protein
VSDPAEQGAVSAIILGPRDEGVAHNVLVAVAQRQAGEVAAEGPA